MIEKVEIFQKKPDIKMSFLTLEKLLSSIVIHIRFYTSTITTEMRQVLLERNGTNSKSARNSTKDITLDKFIMQNYAGCILQFNGMQPAQYEGSSHKKTFSCMISMLATHKKNNLDKYTKHFQEDRKTRERKQKMSI